MWQLFNFFLHFISFTQLLRNFKKIDGGIFFIFWKNKKRDKDRENIISSLYILCVDIFVCKKTRSWRRYMLYFTSEKTKRDPPLNNLSILTWLPLNSYFFFSLYISTNIHTHIFLFFPPRKLKYSVYLSKAAFFMPCVLASTFGIIWPGPTIHRPFTQRFSLLFLLT